MPWNRNDSNPLEVKRRKLAEQERLLAERMSRLTRELHQSGEPVPKVIKPAEPPVWRLEDDAHPHRAAKPISGRRGNLGRQTQRDMIVVFVLIAVLILVVILFVSLAYAPRTE